MPARSPLFVGRARHNSRPRTCAHIFDARERARKTSPAGNPSPSFLRVHKRAVAYYGRDRAYADFNYSPGRTPVTSQARTRARSIYTPCMLNGQRYFATPRHAMPRIRERRERTRISREEARRNAPARDECRRVCTHAVTRARARARLFSRVVIFCLPPPLLAYLLLPHRSPHLIFSRQSLLDATTRCSAMRSFDGNKCIY